MKKIIIDECSIIVHKEIKSDYTPRFNDKNLVRNLKYSYVCEKEYFEATGDVYL